MESRRVAVRGIAYKNKNILAVRHKTHDGESADFWATPGGGLNVGESITDGLTREFIEETGIAPTIGRLLFVQQFAFTHHNGKTLEHLEFFFHITNPDDFETIDLEKTTHGAIELTHCEFIDPKKETILPAFLQTIDLADYITHDRSVFIYDQLGS